jgi:hypothetical protein
MLAVVMTCSYFRLFRLVSIWFTLIGVTSFTVNKAQVRTSLHQYDKIFRSTSASVRSNPTNRFYIPSIIRQNMLPDDIGSTFKVAVEFFDGSTVVDPVVVSNAFWTRLQSNVLSVVLGQFLAAVVFTFLISLARSQLSKLFSFVTEKVFSSSANTSMNGRHQLNVPSNLRDGYDGTIHPDFVKLLLCLTIDIIGSSSTLIPILGDASDLLWAPIAGLLLRSLFHGSNIVFALEFTEEILPLTDVLPLATVCWVVDTFFRDSSVASLLQLGRYAASSEIRIDRSYPIDVDSIEMTSRKDKGFSSSSEETMN